MTSVSNQLSRSFAQMSSVCFTSEMLARALDERDADRFYVILQKIKPAKALLNSLLATSVAKGRSHDTMTYWLLEFGAESKSLVPQGYSLLQAALQSQSDEIVVHAVQQGAFLDQLTEGQWQRVISAIVRLRGVNGLTAIPFPPHILTWGLNNTIIENQPGVTEQLLERGAQVERDLFERALQKGYHNVAIELFNWGISTANLSFALWLELINLLVESNHTNPKNHPLQAEALNRCLKTYCDAQNQPAIENVVKLGANPNCHFTTFLEQKEAGFDNAYTLYKLGATYQTVPRDIWLHFVSLAVHKKHVEELKKEPRQFDKRSLTNVYQQKQVGSVAKVALVTLGAQEPNLALFIEKILLERNGIAVRRLRYLLPMMSERSQQHYLDLYLTTADLIPDDSFKSHTFPETLLQKKLFYYVKTNVAPAVKKLITLGVALDTKDESGKTALQQAISLNHSVIAKLLVNAGADCSHSLHVQTPLALEIEKMYREAFPLVHQIGKDQLLSQQLPLPQRRQLAMTISQLATKKQTLYLKKTREAKSYSLLYRKTGVGKASKRNLYLLLKRKGCLKASGTYKKATEALQIPFTAPKTVAPATSMVQTLSVKTLSKTKLPAIRYEREMQQRVNQLPGIWKVEDSFEYQDSHDHVRACAFSKRAEEFNKIVDKLTFLQKLKVTAQLIIGLQNIHSLNMLHGDLKSNNCVVRMLPNLEVIAGWIDFGFSYLADIGKTNDIIADGFYGCVEATPPELFGHKQFAGDHFKVEVYALGYMLYETIFSFKAPWKQPLRNFQRLIEIKPVTQIEHYILKRCLIDHIEQPLAQQNSQAGTPEESLKMIFLKMMRITPENRLSLQQALDEVNLLINHEKSLL